MSQNRFLLAGVLAGVSSVVAVALAATVMFGIGMLWQYAFNSTIPIIRDMAGGAALDDIGRIPSFLWSWRWALLGMAGAGVLLAYGDRLAQRAPHPWRERIVGTALLGVVSAVVTSVIFATADDPLYDIRNQTGSVPTLAERQQPGWSLLLVAALVSLAIAGLVWLLWSWWYAHWRRWMGLAPSPGGASSRTADEWLAAREAGARFLRRVALLTAAGAALTVAGMLGHSAARTEVRSGDIWAEPASPNVATRFRLSRPTRQLIVENTHGSGSVAVTVLSEQDQAPLAGPALLLFAGEVGTQREVLDVAALPDGSYLLNAQLRSGEGGRVGYALLQGTTALVPFASAAVGLGLGLALAGAALLASSATRGLRPDQNE